MAPRLPHHHTNSPYSEILRIFCYNVIPTYLNNIIKILQIHYYKVDPAEIKYLDYSMNFYNHDYIEMIQYIYKLPIYTSLGLMTGR